MAAAGQAYAEHAVNPRPVVENPTQNSIHLVISAHGSDLEDVDPNQYNNVRIMYSVSHNNLSMCGISNNIISNLLQFRTRTHAPSTEIISSFETNCKQNHEQELGPNIAGHTGWQDDYTRTNYSRDIHDIMHESSLRQSQLGAYCKTSAMVVNRMYSFRNKYINGEKESCLLKYDNSSFDGGILPIRVKLGGKFIPPEQLVNLLSNFNQHPISVEALETTLCQPCDDGVTMATYKCLDCGLVMCNTCNKLLHKLAKDVGHIRLPFGLTPKKIYPSRIIKEMSAKIKSVMKGYQLTLVDLINALRSFNFENIYIYDTWCRINSKQGLVRRTSFVHRAEQDGLRLLLRAPSNDMRNHGDLFFESDELDEKDKKKEVHLCEGNYNLHDADPRLATTYCGNCADYLCDLCNSLRHEGPNPPCLGLSIIEYLGSKRNLKPKNSCKSSYMNCVIYPKHNKKSKKNKNKKSKGSLRKNRENRKR